MVDDPSQWSQRALQKVLWWYHGIVILSHDCDILHTCITMGNVQKHIALP